MTQPEHDLADIRKENEVLRAQLEDAKAILARHRSGDIDAFVTDDSSLPLHTYSAIHDIHDRKWADAALLISETRYRRLFEAAHDGMLILDPDTRKIIDANPFMTSLIGYPRDQLVGTELYEIGFLADAQASKDMFQKLKATRHVRYENLPLQTEQGGLRDVEVVANLYDEGGHSFVQCNVRDITERKRTNLALRESEGRHTFLLKLSDILRPLRDPVDVQIATMQLVVEHLDVIRACYFKVDADQDGLSLTASYDRGTLQIPDHMRLSDFAIEMAAQYRNGRTSFIEDAEAEAPTEVERKAYRAIGVRAGIGVPLVKDGLLLGIFGVHSATPRHWTVAEVQLLEDVADRVWTAVDRAHAEKDLRESAEQQMFLLKFSDMLRAEPSPDAIANRALRMVFEKMQLDRCYVGIYRLAEDTVEFPHQVHDNSLPPLPTQVRLSDFPKALHIASYGTLVIDDVAKMDGLSGSERASFASLGIRALIVATLRKGENNPLWAFVAVSTSPRVWTPGEVSLVEVVAERTWAAVERARAEERLHTAHDMFRQLIDRSPFGVYVINANFQLVQISEGGQKAFANVGPLIGRDFTEVVRAVWPDLFAGNVIAHFRHTLATGEPYFAETNERRADIDAIEAYDWKIERIILPDGGLGVVCHFYDLSERIRHEEHARLLMAEVNHRSKNMLSIVQAIAKRTVATQPEDFIERFGERIRALSASQDLLVKSEWKAVSFGELVRAQLAHFDDVFDSRVTLDGPQLAIKASASQALGMALHELATNAAKYGALSNTSGRVIISWSLPSDAAGQSRLMMSWIESGGPLVAKPTRLGFGSTVTNSMIKMSLGGNVEVDFASTGLVWHFDCPAEDVLAGNALPVSLSKNHVASENPRQATTGRRVLVVEDEPLIAMEIAQTLLEAGYDVIGPANSVVRALALIEQSGCDAAVLDTNLGTDTAEPIARELIRRGTPFIATSGYAHEQQPEIMRTAPLLSKPLKPGILIAEIERCLGLIEPR